MVTSISRRMRAISSISLSSFPQWFFSSERFDFSSRLLFSRHKKRRERKKKKKRKRFKRFFEFNFYSPLEFFFLRAFFKILFEIIFDHVVFFPCSARAEKVVKLKISYANCGYSMCIYIYIYV